MEERIADHVENQVERYRDILERARSGASRWLEMLHVRLDSLQRLIASFSPDAVLKRGFAIITDKTGRLIAARKQAKRGLEVAIRLHDGSVDATIH